MKEISLTMALVDYIPVVLFLLAISIFAKDIKHLMPKALYIIFKVGTLMIFIAGFLKATYKLLYALNIGDFIWLSNQFFSNQAFGFLLTGISISIAVIKPNKNKTYALLPTMFLVGIMVIGVGAMDASFAYLANQLKKRNALALIIISFFSLLIMGYLSSKNFDKAYMNWIVQGINLAGQLCLYFAARIMHKAGLANL